MTYGMIWQVKWVTWSIMTGHMGHTMLSSTRTTQVIWVILIDMWSSIVIWQVIWAIINHMWSSTMSWHVIWVIKNWHVVICHEMTGHIGYNNWHVVIQYDLTSHMGHYVWHVVICHELKGHTWHVFIYYDLTGDMGHLSYGPLCLTCGHMVIIIDMTGHMHLNVVICNRSRHIGHHNWHMVI